MGNQSQHRLHKTEGPVKKTDDPELASVKRLIGLLDKAYRNARIYGIMSPAFQRFVDQLYTEVTAHMTAHGSLSFVVQGFRLFYRGEVVYENPSPNENLAFKLFADGIRELAFNRGLLKEDLVYFLETLGGEHGTQTLDEDIITRLWEKNLPTISLVTAEEIVKSLDLMTFMAPQDTNTMNSPVSYVSKIHSAEAVRRAHVGATGATAQGKTGAQSDLAEFQVSQQELEKLAQEIVEESKRDSLAYVLDVLFAILASEQSPALLSKILDVCEEILEKLTRQGNWKLLNQVLGLLHEMERWPDLSEALRMKLAGLLATPAQPSNIQAMAMVLNPSPQISTDGFLPFLLQLNPAASPSLCDLLARLDHQEHRSVVCDALVVLAKDAPEPLVTGLDHRTGPFVKNLVNILTRLGDPRLADSLEKASQHQDSMVRKEVVRAFSLLRPTGNGSPLMAFIQDPDGAIRLSALKLLAGGEYTVPFQAWVPILSGKAFRERSNSEQRTILRAVSRTAGAEAVPYWRQLLVQRLWTKRAHKLELASLAAEALGKIGTPNAISALEAGRKRRNRVIRNACSTALAALEKQSQGKASEDKHQ
jgi:hypothetical protein